MQRRPSRVLGLSLVTVVACGDNLKQPAAPDAASTVDAPSQSAFTAIPLTTPDGSFYTANVTIGSQTFAVDVDTGSTTIGVAGSACTSCTGISPLYSAGAGAMDDMKTASTQYGDGSKWSGEIFTDMVNLGSVMPQVAVNFVNITSDTGFFSGNQNLYQGIFGLGPSLLLEPGTTAYLDAIKAKGLSTAMSFELCDTAGTMWLGGYDPNASAGPMVYTPIVAGGGFWGVHITDISMGGTSLGVDPQAAGAPIVDTGTTLWYMPSTVVNAIMANVNASPGKTALFGDVVLGGTGSGSGSGSGFGGGSGSGFGSGSGSGSGGGGGHHGNRCLTATGVTADMVDAMLPTMTLTFPNGNGGTVTLTAPASKSYLDDMGNGRFCLNVSNGTNLGVSILGDRFLKSFVTTIDNTNSRIGFAPDKGCSVAARVWTEREPFTEHGHPPHAP